MQFDGISMRACISQASLRLTGARLQRIYQVSPLAIALEMWAAGTNTYLVCSAEAEAACIFVMAAKPGTVEDPTPFVSLLRRHLVGSRLESAQQAGWDRIATFSFRGRNELGDSSKLSLAIETMGKHSNLICVREDGRILDAAKRVGRSRSRVRQVLPGLTYQLPPAEPKLPPDGIDAASIRELLAAPDTEDDHALPLRHAVTALVRGVSGLGPERARELLRAPYAGHASGGGGGEQLWHAIAAALNATATLAATGGTAGGAEGVEASFWAALKPRPAPGGGGAPAGAGSHGRQRSLLGQVERVAARASGLAEATRAKLEIPGGGRQARTQAEAIMSSLAEVRGLLGIAAGEGRTEIDVELPTYSIDSPDNQDTIVIHLRTEVDPVVRAQELFAEYSDANRRRQALLEVLAGAQARADRLATLAFQLQQEITADELAEIAVEAEKLGAGPRGGTGPSEAVPGRPQTKRRQLKAGAGGPVASRPRRSLSPGGLEVLVGRNNHQNDAIVRLSRGDDLWFHARGVPGAHVLLRKGGHGAVLPPEDIEYAAGLAALHSQARHSGSVAVDYCPARQLRKEKGAAPGFVTYSGETTLHVSPAEVGEGSSDGLKGF